MITESPIEAKFAEAVQLYDDALTILPSSDLDTFIRAFLVLGIWDFTGAQRHDFACAPQVQIGPYRVDFCFVADCIYGKPLLVAVECDGHEFHERTKEQAARDKLRDRDLMRRGVHVMRFTGSEIHKDAEACFYDEVFSYMLDRHQEGVDQLHKSVDYFLEKRRAAS